MGTANTSFVGPPVSLRRAAGLAVVLWAAFGCIAVFGEDAVPSGYRGYSLKHVDAAKIAPQLRSLLDGAAGQGEILIDRNANRILLKGPDEAHRLAGEFLGTLDTPAAATQEKESATVVRGYAVEGARLDEQFQALQQRYKGQSTVRLVLDKRTSQIIVAAPEDKQQEIRQRLQGGTTGVGQELAAPVRSGNQPRNNDGPQLMGESTEVVPQPATEGYQLKNMAWRDFEDALRRIWGNQMSLETERNGEIAKVILPTSDGPRAVMQIDRRQDQVSFDRSRPDARAWSQVARALDAPRVAVDEQTVVLPQRNVDPANVYRAISLLRSLPGNGGVDAPAQAILAPARQASPAWGGELLTTIFQPAGAQPPAAAPPQPAPGTAQPAPAPAPGQPDSAPMGQPGENAPVEGSDSATIGPVRIEYIEGLDVFIIRGNRGDVARVRAIIEQIQEQSKQTQPVIEVYQLRFANSVAVGTLITELYEAVFATRQSPVSITPLDKPNAILLIGQRESVASIAELIEKLDTPVVPSSQFRVFRLKHLSAIDAETTVRNFFVDRPGSGDTVRPGLGIRVRVIADYRTNALLVQAGPRDMAEISALLDKLDMDKADANVELRVFRLKNALASDMVEVLQEAITGVPSDQQQGGAAGQAGVGATRPQSTRRSTNISIVSVDKEGNRLIESGILADMVVTADPNVNALLVRGPTNGMDLMAELIRQLDQLPEAEAQIKVFTLENGDATTLTALLQELFGQTVTAGQGTLGQAFNVQRQNVQSLTGGGEGSLVPLRFAVDVRTNSIVTTGSRADLNVVEILLLRLDEGGIESRKTEVYFLQNAPALDVANAIQTFLNNQRQITQQLFAFQAVTSFEQIDREVIVVPEVVTNSLIVSATPRYYDAIQKIIQDLDYRPPMVLVQVILAAVSLNDQFEFGVELGLQDSLLFDRGRSNIGYNFNNTALPLGNDNTAVSNASRGLVAGQALTNLLVGRQNPTLGYGGLVLSAANESVNILVRALQDQGRLQVLARPQVMTLDNEEAFVQIGQRVPRVTGSNITPQGGSTSTFVDEPVGLILRIRPRVNQQDVVVMTVDTERSELNFNEAVTISADGLTSPVIETITAQTTLSARSGQTVVFAGLISKRKNVLTQRVPYLSNIPILGHLFRFDSETTKREELLIIMTPHIVRSDEDIERLKYVESDRMSWCLADLVEMHEPAGLAGGHGLWNPPATPTIYPAVDPTGAELVPTPAPTMMGSGQPGATPRPVPQNGPSAGVLQPPSNGSGGAESSRMVRPSPSPKPTDGASARSVQPIPAVVYDANGQAIPANYNQVPVAGPAPPAGYAPPRYTPPQRLPAAP